MSEYASEHQGAAEDIELAWQTARYQNAARTALEAMKDDPAFDKFQQELRLRSVAAELALRAGREERLIPAYKAVQYAVTALRLPRTVFEPHLEYVANKRAALAAEDYAAGIDRGEDLELTIEDNGMLLAAGALTCDELLVRLGVDSSEQPRI